MKTIGIKWELIGLKSEAHIFVSNHISWIDILVINSTLDVVFVAKKEVRSWPGLGLLAVLGQTIFIERKSLNALSQKCAFEESLKNICNFGSKTQIKWLRSKPFPVPKLVLKRCLI